MTFFEDLLVIGSIYQITLEAKCKKVSILPLSHS